MRKGRDTRGRFRAQELPTASQILDEVYPLVQFEIEAGYRRRPRTTSNPLPPKEKK